MPPGKSSDIGVAFYKQGLAEVKAGRYAEALSSFDRAISMSENSLVVQDGRVVAMLKMAEKEWWGRKDGGRESAWYKSAVTLVTKMCEMYGKESFKPYFRRAEVLASAKLFTLAAPQIETALKHPAFLAAPDRVQDLVRQLRDRIAHGQRTVQRGAIEREETRKLNAELHAEIQRKSRINFTYLLTDDIILSIAEHGLRDRPGFGLKMGGICRRWREVVINRPGLWGTLVLGQRRPAAKAGLWLKRSEGRIKEVTFRQGFDVTKAEALAELLEDVVENVRSIEIRCDPTRIVAVWKGRCRKLERLKIGNGEVLGIWAAQARDIDAGLLHDGCDTLREIEHHGGRISHDMARPREADWHGRSKLLWMADPGMLRNVKKIRLDSCTIHSSTSDPQHLLRHLPNVVEIALDNIVWYDWTSSGDTTGLPKLETVYLDSLRSYSDTGSTNALGPRFEHIKAPYLTSLNLWRTTLLGPNRDLIHHIRAPGLAPALATLQSLDIGKCHIPEADLLNLLYDLPELRFLNVSHCDLTNGFLEVLTPKSEDDYRRVIVPKLTSLSIAGSGEIGSAALRDFVFSRLPQDIRSKLRRNESTSGTNANAKASQSSQSQSSQGSQGQKRGTAFRPTAPSQPTKRSAFGPTLPSQSRVGTGKSAIRLPPATAPPALNTPQRVALPPLARIEWLNVDHCERVHPDVITVLEKHVRWVSHWCGVPVEERIRGKGRWSWNAGWTEECEDDDDEGGGCRLRQVPGTKDFQVWHTCRRKTVELVEPGSSFSKLDKTGEGAGV